MNSVPIHIEAYHIMIGVATNTFFGSNTIDALKEYLVKRNTTHLFDIRQKIICNRLKKLDLSPYALRKFFYHNMIKAQVPKLLVEHWMGHIKPTQPVNMPIEEMKRIYLRAYPYIDISKTQYY
ncbi:hypothetical protein MUP77_16365 [Candidatus Bathyarchaeota archaeon]|nr:hypothetical protein [Candidatus Bathyarchaeota archaeon]